MGTAWNYTDSLKEADNLESTLLMSEEEEQALIAQLKIDQEHEANAFRAKELARLRGELSQESGEEDSVRSQPQEPVQPQPQPQPKPQRQGSRLADAGDKSNTSATTPPPKKAPAAVKQSPKVARKPLAAVKKAPSAKNIGRSSMVSVATVDNFGEHNINS